MVGADGAANAVRLVQLLDLRGVFESAAVVVVESDKQVVGLLLAFAFRRRRHGSSPVGLESGGYIATRARIDPSTTKDPFRFTLRGSITRAK